MKRFWYLMMILLASLAIVGCDEEEEGAVPFDSTYGEGVKSEGRYSVNGTAVFANMFESAGHNVRFSTRLDSRVRSSDVIIWAPDSFLVPMSRNAGGLNHGYEKKQEKHLSISVGTMMVNCRIGVKS